MPHLLRALTLLALAALLALAVEAALLWRSARDARAEAIRTAYIRPHAIMLRYDTSRDPSASDERRRAMRAAEAAGANAALRECGRLNGTTTLDFLLGRVEPQAIRDDPEVARVMARLRASNRR